MSGIGAVVSQDGSPISRSDVERMRNVLTPYGRDRQKILVQRRVALVACLHHLTPEDLFEQQPLVTGERFATVFDGRIDNRDEIAAALGISPAELQSMPDSVLVFRAWDRWREAGFARLAGVFAVIIADVRSGELVCARDHLGLRVLHYHRSRERFAIATSPDALFALSWVPKILNQDKVADTLVQRGLNGETTYYRDICRVMPGTAIQVTSDRIGKQPFWDPMAIPDVRYKRDEEYVEALQHHIEQAVRANLRSRRVPCSTITGGLDSSTLSVIAADMLAQRGERLHTFTAVPEAGFSKPATQYRYFDETEAVRQIAALNGNIEPHFIPPSAKPLVEHIAEQMRIGGAPSGGILNGLWTMDVVSAARSAGHDVMISGDMGNLTMSFSGSPLFAELLATGRLWRLANEIIQTRGRRKRIIKLAVIAPFVPAQLFRWYKRFRAGGNSPWYSYSAVSDSFAERSGVVARAAREYLPFDAPPRRDGRQSRIDDICCYSESADWFGRLRAAFGVDVRTPAFDKRLVEFCLGVPNDQYLHMGEDRWLIRRAMRGRLPEAVLRNTRIGDQASDWYPRLTRERDQMREAVMCLSRNPDVAAVVNCDKLMRILDQWPSAEPARGSDGFLLAEFALPQGLGAAMFIENVIGRNVESGRLAHPRRHETDPEA